MGTTVSVETWQGEGAYGAVYAAPVDIVCNVDSTTRLVRNANGEEVVSEVTLEVKYTDAAAFAPESRVTISGRVSTVLSASPKQFKGQVVYVKVSCT
jgi:adenosyl cobinamide kinase/adenosyl cobinamide phosphate guanylyltransferase